MIVRDLAIAALLVIVTVAVYAPVADFRFLGYDDRQDVYDNPRITGGLTGPCIKPIAIKLVWEAAQAVAIPIIGMGGIQNAADAIEFMMAGATAVAVGTANFYEPQTALQVIAGIREFIQKHGIKDVREITGSVQTTK